MSVAMPTRVTRDALIREPSRETEKVSLGKSSNRKLKQATRLSPAAGSTGMQGFP